MREFKGRGRPDKRFSSPGRDMDRGRGRSRDSSGPLEMHSAVCDECGKDCELPFKPTSSKPVYCSDCFRKKEGTSTGRGSSSRSFSRGGDSSSSSPDLEMIKLKLDKLEIISMKLDKIIKKLGAE